MHRLIWNTWLANQPWLLLYMKNAPLGAGLETLGKSNKEGEHEGADRPPYTSGLIRPDPRSLSATCGPLLPSDASHPILTVRLVKLVFGSPSSVGSLDILGR
jgi:hypothetical protein